MRAAMGNIRRDVRKSSAKSERTKSSAKLASQNYPMASSKEYKWATTGSQKRNLNSDVENVETGSHPPSPAVPSEKGQAYPPYKQLSPRRALREAYMKIRFADIIVKAKYGNLMNFADKEDLVKMQREKEKFIKEQQKVKARIEAKIRADEAVARMKEEVELKMQRETEAVAQTKEEANLQAQREAAHLALQKMVQTVYINENSDQIFRDLEALAYGPDRLQSFNGRRPLEQLGLFFKEHSMEEEDALADNVKEVEGVEAVDWLSADVSKVGEGKTMVWEVEEGEFITSADDGDEVKEGEIL